MSEHCCICLVCEKHDSLYYNTCTKHTPKPDTINVEAGPRMANQVTRRRGLYKRKVDLVKTNQRILTVLDREVEQLMYASQLRKLDEEESKALVAYAKLIRDLLGRQEGDNAEASSDILGKIAESDKS